MKEAFKTENGGDGFIAVKRESLEGLKEDKSKQDVIDGLKGLSQNVYWYEAVKDDKSLFEFDKNGKMTKTLNGMLLSIKVEKFKDDEAVIEATSWFGNLGAVTPRYKAVYQNGQWQLDALNTIESVTNQKVVETGVPANLKIYKYSELGYEIAYPENYDTVLSGGHSPLANPEFEMRLSLYSKDGLPGLDIDSIDKVNYKDKYQNIEGFIKYKDLNLKIDENFIINDEPNKIYKLKEDTYYFAFFENDKHIFQLSSSSKDILKKIMMTFKFI